MPGWVNFQSATLGQFCIGGNIALIRLPRALETEAIHKPDFRSLGQHRSRARIEIFSYVHQSTSRLPIARPSPAGSYRHLFRNALL
jgi:hypothetical protein